MRNSSRVFLLGRSAVFFVVLICALVVNAQDPAKSTAGPVFLSALEAEVIAEINSARANPKKYAAFLEEYKEYYNGKSYLPPSRKKPVTTFDGGAAVDEAIRFLQATGPLGALQPSKGLSFGAKDHALDLAQKGVSGHRGSDGSLPNDRVSRYGTWKSTVGEAIVYRVSTAREMVLELIIDDGTPDHAHRRNVFEPNFQVAGVAISPQTNFGSFCVIVYASVFADKAGLGATGTSAKAAAPSSKAPTKSPTAKKATKAKGNKPG